MRQTRGASRRRTLFPTTCSDRDSHGVSDPSGQARATSGARSGVAHAMVSSSDCDTDDGQRAAKSAARISDSRADHAGL